jgi:uncharacterized protein (TIGR03437 family)
MNEEVVLNRFIFFPAMLVVVGFETASAQTPANISIVQGNGQLICATCPQANFRFFDPMVVRVTDASGSPVPNTQVSWIVTSGTGSLNSQSFTDGNGNSQNTYFQSSQAGTLLQPFLQSTIVASAGNASATFTLTQGLSNLTTGLQYVQVGVRSPAQGTAFTGSAGSQSSVQLQAVATAITGLPIPGVSLRLLNNQDPTQGPSVACVTGAGADPGSVLTDSTGLATCTPVFGPVAGTGSFAALVGGVLSSFNNNNQPIGYFQSSNFGLTVTPGIPGAISLVSGNNQSANPGQALAVPLVAQVSDKSGNPLAGQAVTWTVSPAGAAALSNTSSASNAAGQVSTNASLSAGASGQVQVKVASSTNPQISYTFTITANAQITGLQKISGDGQSIAVNTAFPTPLTVQITTSSGAGMANIPVLFTVTGPVTLSAYTMNTDSSGRAQVTAQAGGTPAPATVTAASGAFNVTFNLTVTPPAPTITASAFYNGADFKQGSISPCSIATIIAPGIAPNIQGVVSSGQPVGAQPYQLANVTVAFRGSLSPIYSVSNINGQQQVTFQLPCDVTPGNSVPVTVTVNGNPATVNVPVLPASPGIFQTVMSDGRLRAVLVRPDGSFVSLTNPARRGEQIVAFLTGLGPTMQANIGTNSVPAPGTTASVLGQVIVGINNSGVPVVSSQLSPDLIGVYEVTFLVPPDAPQGNNIVFSVAVNPPNSSTTQFSNGSAIPIQ